MKKIKVLINTGNYVRLLEEVTQDIGTGSAYLVLGVGTLLKKVDHPCSGFYEVSLDSYKKIRLAIADSKVRYVGNPNIEGPLMFIQDYSVYPIINYRPGNPRSLFICGSTYPIEFNSPDELCYRVKLEDGTHYNIPYEYVADPSQAVVEEDPVNP
jgi:hypothetical protein